MLRYRCPQCAQLLQAHELRAGKKSVCVACLTTHIIPIDRSAWLTASGEPLFSRLPFTHGAIAQTVEDRAQPAMATAQPVIPPVDPEPAPALETVVAVTATESFSSPSSFTNEMDSPPTEEPREPEQVTSESPTSADVIAPHFPEEERLHSPAIEPISQIATVERADDKIHEIGKASEPVHVQTQVEIAAALTEVLTHRMKPPRQPRRDLRVSTAGWLILTGLGIAFLIATLFTSASYKNLVIAIGIAQVLIGYGWIIFLTSHRDPKRGIACAVPPVTFYYLGQWKYARFRPLRFCVTGAVLMGLGLLSSQASPLTKNWVGKGSKREPVPVVDPATMSKLEKLREYKNRNAYDKLIDLLQELKQTDSLKSVDAKDAPELTKELRELCFHQDTGVKVAALAAYTQWGGEDARELCLKAIESPSQEERMMALQLLPRWKSTDAAFQVARNVAALIGRPGTESARAEAALVEIGGVPAERAALAVLLRSEDRTTRLIALSILAKVGGTESLSPLRSYADTSLDKNIKDMSLETIDAIQARVTKKP